MTSPKWSDEIREQARALARQGVAHSQISRQIGVPMGTLGRWCCGHGKPRRIQSGDVRRLTVQDRLGGRCLVLSLPQWWPSRAEEVQVRYLSHGRGDVEIMLTPPDGPETVHGTRGET